MNGRFAVRQGPFREPGLSFAVATAQGCATTRLTAFPLIHFRLTLPGRLAGEDKVRTTNTAAISPAKSRHYCNRPSREVVCSLPVAFLAGSGTQLSVFRAHPGIRRG